MAAVNGTERYVNVVSSAVRSNYSTRGESQDSCLWCFFNVGYFNEVFFVKNRNQSLVQRQRH